MLHGTIRTMYGRAPFSFPRLTPTVKALLIALGGAFVVEAVLQKALGLPLFQLLALHPVIGLQSLWQVVTYVWVEPPVPDAVGGLLIGMLFAYLILSPFEERYGPRRLVQLCAASTLGAAFAVLILALLYPAPGGYFLAGSEPWVLGGIAAFAATVRGGQLLFFGVFPMRAWHLIGLVLGYSALISLLASNPFHLAMTSGAVGAGVGFVRWMTRPRTPRMSRARRPRNGRGVPMRLIRGDHDGDDDDEPKWLN